MSTEKTISWQGRNWEQLGAGSVIYDLSKSTPLLPSRCETHWTASLDDLKLSERSETTMDCLS